jgi:thiamine pyrophosphate-dependent acetolactate synthase large subunit-like protein
MGVPGSRVGSLEAFAKSLRDGFASDGPTLIEVPL